MYNNVGYSQSSMNNFSVNIESLSKIKKVTNMSIVNTFYSIMGGNKKDIKENAKEIMSILLVLSMASHSKTAKYYGMTYQRIMKDITFSRLNRGLYSQKSIMGLLRKDDEVETINVLGAKYVSEGKLEAALCLIPIMVGKDLEDLLMNEKELSKLLDKLNILGKTFVSIKEVLFAIRDN